MLGYYETVCYKARTPAKAAVQHGRREIAVRRRNKARKGAVVRQQLCRQYRAGGFRRLEWKGSLWLFLCWTDQASR